MSKNKKQKNILQNIEINEEANIAAVVDYSESSNDESVESEVLAPNDDFNTVATDEPSNPEDDVTNDDNLDESVESDISECGDTSDVDELPETVEDDVEIDMSENDEQEVSVEPTPTAVEIEVPKVSSMIYRVGTDIINGKCINQYESHTSNLDLAKEKCVAARNKYKKSYHVFDASGNAVYTSEYSTPKDNYYRVGTDWKNGKCINQKHFTVNYNEACNMANESTKNTGDIHNVYDPSGKLMFSAKKKLVLLSYKKRGMKNVNWYTK